MNYPRVNLLNKNEQRYQGAVSRKFIFISAVVAPILVISLLSGVKLIQYSGVQSELLSSRVIWEDLEPRLALYKEERRGLNMNRTGLDLFNGWSESQASFVKLLTDIQANVPEQIQFTRLSVRSQPTAAVYTTPEGMELSYELLIDGTSQGRLAENYVIGLQKSLLESEQIGSEFDSLKLVSMRKHQGNKAENIREFRLEGQSTEKGTL
ncbi:MAG: hypothetical protein V3V05_02975 [Pontiella sp.]